MILLAAVSRSYMIGTMQRLALAPALAWVLLALMIALTLGPASLRPVTPVEHDTEHILAFALVGAAFAWAYPARRLALAFAGVAMTVILELLQIYAPGRHARVIDVVSNAAGVCAGIALVAIYAYWRRKRT